VDYSKRGTNPFGTVPCPPRAHILPTLAHQTACATVNDCELQGYFVRMNVPYRPGDNRNDASDIDIVAVHPSEDTACIACEVKGWHNDRLTMSYWKDWPLLNFTCAPATAAVRELIGNRALKHVLVVPPISERQRDAVEGYANERNVELLEWPKLIKEMISFVDVQRNARNQTDHVLRSLLKYKFLNSEVSQ
jgi:hypothetical protein